MRYFKRTDAVVCPYDKKPCVLDDCAFFCETGAPIEPPVDRSPCNLGLWQQYEKLKAEHQLNAECYCSGVRN